MRSALRLHLDFASWSGVWKDGQSCVLLKAGAIKSFHPITLGVVEGVCSLSYETC